MNFKMIIYGVGCLFIAACSNETNKTLNKELTAQLHGEWRNVYMKLSMNSYKNTDSSKVFEVTEQNWTKKMNIQPIRTFFRKDGTYNSEHRNLSDSIVFNPAGRWAIYGDSLVMTDTFPSIGQAYRYKVVLKDSLVEFYGLEDSDNDGQKDDLYYGVQRRQR